MLTDVYVIAGEGTSTPIQSLKRLHYVYGGDPSKWQKKAGTVRTRNFAYEIHWYENSGKVPEVEIKLKGVKQSES